MLHTVMRERENKCEFRGHTAYNKSSVMILFICSVANDNEYIFTFKKNKLFCKC